MVITELRDLQIVDFQNLFEMMVIK
jgi:hypothetical protein